MIEQKSLKFQKLEKNTRLIALEIWILIFYKNKNFEKTIELNPKFYQAYYNIGIVQSLLGNLYEAQKSYIRAININENYFQAFNNLGALLIKLKKNEDAINVLKRAIEIKSNY